jgi:hypothetical protein
MQIRFDPKRLLVMRYCFRQMATQPEGVCKVPVKSSGAPSEVHGSVVKGLRRWMVAIQGLKDACVFQQFRPLGCDGQSLFQISASFVKLFHIGRGESHAMQRVYVERARG